jgi:hypothetical protein
MGGYLGEGRVIGNRQTAEADPPSGMINRKARATTKDEIQRFFSSLRMTKGLFRCSDSSS